MMTMVISDEIESSTGNSNIRIGNVSTQLVTNASGQATPCNHDTDAALGYDGLAMAVMFVTAFILGAVTTCFITYILWRKGKVPIDCLKRSGSTHSPGTDIYSDIPDEKPFHQKRYSLSTRARQETPVIMRKQMYQGEELLDNIYEPVGSVRPQSVHPNHPRFKSMYSNPLDRIVSTGPNEYSLEPYETKVFPNIEIPCRNSDNYFVLEIHNDRSKETVQGIPQDNSPEYATVVKINKHFNRDGSSYSPGEGHNVSNDGHTDVNYSPGNRLTDVFQDGHSEMYSSPCATPNEVTNICTTPKEVTNDCTIPTEVTNDCTTPTEVTNDCTIQTEVTNACTLIDASCTTRTEVTNACHVAVTSLPCNYPTKLPRDNNIKFNSPKRHIEANSPPCNHPSESHETYIVVSPFQCNEPTDPTHKNQLEWKSSPCNYQRELSQERYVEEKSSPCSYPTEVFHGNHIETQTNESLRYIVESPCFIVLPSELRSVPGNSPNEVRSVPDNSPFEVRSVPDNSSIEVRSVPDNSSIEVRSVTDNSSIEVRSVPDNSPVEVRSVPDNSSIEVRSVPDNSSIEVRSVPDNSSIEVRNVPDNSPIEVRSVPDNSPIEVRSVPVNSSIEVRSVPENSPIEVRSVPDNSPIELRNPCYVPSPSREVKLTSNAETHGLSACAAFGEHFYSIDLTSDDAHENTYF